MTRHVRLAEPSDRDLLVEMMAAFYAESGTPFDAVQAGRAFEILLAANAEGTVWILERPGAAAGYAVLTTGFSMEYGGRDAFLDDLYVRREHRGLGLGRAAMEVVLEECRRRGVRALHLEVARDNSRAKELYRSLAFVDHGRQLMTLYLDDQSASAGDAPDG
jgi:ribosomal protein S18 acetylase RimI-like enzyme